MRYRLEILLLLLLTGCGLFAYRSQIPPAFSYTGMLFVLMGARWLSPEWFEEAWFRWLWWACGAVAALGLILEIASQLGW